MVDIIPQTVVRKPDLWIVNWPAKEGGVVRQRLLEDTALLGVEGIAMPPLVQFGHARETDSS